MKSNFITGLLLLIPILFFSQTSNDKTVYLDSLMQETSAANHKYYRIIKDYKLNNKIYTILDYYKSGALYMEKTSISKGGYSADGDITYYYENGNKKSLANFINSVQVGDDFEWYENGNKKQYRTYVSNYDKGKAVYKINGYWDVNGVQKVIDGNGKYEYFDEKHSERGKIKNGFRDSIWEGSFKKPKFSYKEVYEDGRFVSGLSTYPDGKTSSYTVIEKKPEPKYGIGDFYKFIGENYRTPNVKGLQGRIYMRFVVDANGKIVEPKIIRDLGYGTGEEAARVITSYEGFVPGEQRGTKIRCVYSIPITIKSMN